MEPGDVCSPVPTSPLRNAGLFAVPLEEESGGFLTDMNIVDSLPQETTGKTTATTTTHPPPQRVPTRRGTDEYIYIYILSSPTSSTLRASQSKKILTIFRFSSSNLILFDYYYFLNFLYVCSSFSCACIYIYIYIYVYMRSESKRGTERERENEYTYIHICVHFAAIGILKFHPLQNKQTNKKRAEQTVSPSPISNSPITYPQHTHTHTHTLVLLATKSAGNRRRGLLPQQQPPLPPPPKKKHGDKNRPYHNPQKWR
ncbi:hypothetical protein MOQ_008350 [Trypanosoma cruzi marinkellei]|uniref:Uncharacterized protein n=1 Tax=Trypanosoma cruzi marinkellei TaxID=85056 RepID=K2ML92_TRYCR|nr:hypothetical protein MOQ_008350 [Trypanosoma cruzi marinkellei]